jgi:hypothetical protein
MRCMKFDDRDGRALRALDFSISDDGEVAKFEGEMRIDIIRPVNSDRLWVAITLPAGESLRFLMPCADLSEAAGIDDDEAVIDTIHQQQLAAHDPGEPD